jgi:hypothetical protein
MSFDEFKEGCPLITERGTCDVWQPSSGSLRHPRCQCDPKNCPSYHTYRKVIKTIEKLKNHCHYHFRPPPNGRGSGYDKKVTFEEENV